MLSVNALKFGTEQVINPHMALYLEADWAVDIFPYGRLEFYYGEQKDMKHIQFYNRSIIYPFSTVFEQVGIYLADYTDWDAQRIFTKLARSIKRMKLTV